MSKDHAPRLKEQYKDFAVEVERNLPVTADLRKKKMELKEAEINSNPKKTEEWCDHVEGEDNGQE